VKGAIKTSPNPPKLPTMNTMNYFRPWPVAALIATLLCSAAFAQTGKNYDVKTMNFDLWCQEQAHLPAPRCDKRTPEDEKTFEAYRAQIERYEVPYLQQQQHDLTINRDIMHNDPVDNPVHQNPQAQTQDPNRQPQSAPP
jgi:hypothetical protein